MTQQQYIINRKLNVLELGQTLGNISEACASWESAASTTTTSNKP